jgi:hypothetical protein
MLILAERALLSLPDAKTIGAMWQLVLGPTTLAPLRPQGQLIVGV